MYIMLKFFLLHAYALSLTWGAFTYDVGFLGDQVGQAESDFTKQAYVAKYLIRVGRSKIPKKRLASYVNGP